MKKLLPFVIAALLVPSVALAKPGNPHKGGPTNKGKAKVQYVLKGQLSTYGAYDSATSTNGSITITVTRANRHGRALKGQSLSFTGMVTSSTKVVLENGVTAIADNDQGIVKIRAPKEPRSMPVRQIVDQGPAS
jgi:hypothetical protein